MAAGRALRTDRAEETRERILSAAERLFAEHGVLGVSNRQVGEAAGQGNNFAVGYHFGTKTDLVRAVARRHGEPMERARAQLLAALGPAPDLRDWLDCLVRPVTRHLDALGSPSWCARFTAQVTTEPTLRALSVEDAVAEPALRAVLEGLHSCLPALPEPVQAERSAMVGQLVVHMCAERERDLAAGTPTPRASWDEAADGLVDAMVGLLLAPSVPRTGRTHTEERA
jgi:AcrR family transcriptional regulator